MTEDSDSYLAERQIDRQLEKPSAGPRYERKQSGDQGVYKRVLEALIVLAVASLIGAVWNLTSTATLLQATQDAQRRDIDRIERRQDTLEGKLTRGDAGALDQ